jgi:hypothetical protein
LAAGEQDGPRRTIVITRQQPSPDSFDPDDCRVCVVDAGLLDHYDRVQPHENALAAACRLTWQAHRSAHLTMWVSGLAPTAAVTALLVALLMG